MEDNIVNSSQISGILLKLKEYDEKLADLSKIGTNETNISSNLGKIGDNENSISSNLIEINNIKDDINVKIRKDIFDKIYIYQKPKSLVVCEGRPDFSFLFKSCEIDSSQGRLVK